MVVVHNGIGELKYSMISLVIEALIVGRIVGLTLKYKVITLCLDYEEGGLDYDDQYDVNDYSKPAASPIAQSKLGNLQNQLLE